MRRSKGRFSVPGGCWALFDFQVWVEKKDIGVGSARAVIC